jgi:hypothetical protein
MIFDFTVLGMRPNTFGAVIPKPTDAIAANTAVLSEYPDLQDPGRRSREGVHERLPFGFASHLASLERTSYALRLASGPNPIRKDIVYVSIRDNENVLSVARAYPIY